MSILDGALQRLRSLPRSRRSSSLSDTAAYRAICASAATDETSFASFRQQPEYTRILEHVTETEGLAYLAILESDARVLEFLRSAAPVSSRGGPIAMDFGFGHPISPSLLRYAKVVKDLRDHFGDLDGYRIVEIGVGYGGQCQVVCGVHDVARYSLIDLPEPLALSRVWLEPYRRAATMEYIDALAEDHGGDESDLFISNYAFSEIERPIQERIIERWAGRSRRGYVTYNHIGLGRDIMSAVEFARIMSGSILPESPLTHRENCIVVWGSEKWSRLAQ